jgi:hypothetical protein
MKSNILLDTGLLVAIVNRREAFHQWATGSSGIVMQIINLK